MKKFLILMLALSMVLCSFAACDEDKEESDEEKIESDEEESEVVSSDGGNTDDAIDESDGKITISSIEVGDVCTFGTYEQDNDTTNGTEPIEWIVLDKTDTSILVISKYALDRQPYNSEYGDTTWETCTLRAWLNETFINNAFNAEEQMKIFVTKVVAEDNLQKGTEAGNDTQDKIFLLSISEAETYFSSGMEKSCKATAYSEANGAYVDGHAGYTVWWLRTPGNRQGSAAGVLWDNTIAYGGEGVADSAFTVRPAMWITID